MLSRRPARACDDSSISTYQGCGLPSGSRQPLPCFTTASSPSRAISSKLVTLPPARSCASLSRLERRLRRGHADEGGLDRARPRKSACSTAAVMMPSVPSAPMNRFLQVVAGIVLLELVEVVEHAAVGEHHFEPEHVRARDAVGERGDAAGIGREIAADGAGAFRRQRDAETAGRLRRRPRARAAG